MEGGNAFCAMLQAAATKAAKSTTTSGKGTVSTNVADYKEKDLQAALASATVTTSVLLELIASFLVEELVKRLLEGPKYE